MVNEETRAAVVAFHKQGMRNPAIVNMLDLHRNKVKRIVDRFEATGEIKDRRKTKDRKDRNLQESDKSENPEESGPFHKKTGERTRKHGISDGTVCKVLK
ncbi:hypothetical protein L596_000306 [Steinernema carpocapsae]|uniref:Paired domain-containing protein n=1 Tax=Steinernema carpocapsae TaxID=34508 RepID=A0A4U8UID7_STECR|nr:hypothetical protein L596_030444 [Steinernema carpocapsae]TMS32476.1 hypothetical protein L596_000306 [Steinernema carpocapsae]